MRKNVFFGPADVYIHIYIYAGPRGLTLCCIRVTIVTTFLNPDQGQDIRAPTLNGYWLVEFLVLEFISSAIDH